MTQYEWRHDTPRIRPDGERFVDGDSIDPTPHERRVWPDRIVAVDVSDDDAETDAALDVETVDGIGPALADELRELGYETTDDLRTATAEALTAVDGISDEVARDVKRQVDDG